MLSPKQTSLYWRLWSGVLKARSQHHLPSTEKTLLRYAFHKEYGLPESMTAFNPRGHFDIFKTACERIINGSGPSATTAPEDGERNRLIYRIQEDARMAKLDNSYIAKISTDLTGLGCWKLLDLADLKNLRDAIHNRAGTKLGHDTRTHGQPTRQYILHREKTSPAI